MCVVEGGGSRGSKVSFYRLVELDLLLQVLLHDPVVVVDAVAVEVVHLGCGGQKRRGQRSRVSGVLRWAPPQPCGTSVLPCKV